MDFRLPLHIWQSELLVGLGRFVKAERLVSKQLLAHSKNGCEKGEPGGRVSLFLMSSAMSLTQ
jgi:hypothetical protein